MMEMTDHRLTRLINNDFPRYLLSGGFNTLVTYGVYLLLLQALPYKTSYTIAYIGGIFLSYILNRYFVFKSDRGVKSLFLFPVVYLAQYLISLIIIWLWIEKLNLDERAAPILAIAITVPMTFILSKYIFSNEPPPKI